MRELGIMALVFAICGVGCWTQAPAAGPAAPEPTLAAEPTPAAPAPVAPAPATHDEDDADVPDADIAALGRLSGPGGGWPNPPTPPPARVVVAPQQATMTAGLDKAIIKRVIRQHVPRIRYCYERQLVQDPALAGRVMIDFTIDANGRVSAATAQGFHAEIERCLVDALRAMQFPPPHGGGSVRVSYPFLFRADP
jgi:TonB family protein